jgi:outer membrane protein assembly factor BamB
MMPRRSGRIAAGSIPAATPSSRVPRLLAVALVAASLSGCGTIARWFSDSKTKPVDLTDIKTTLSVRTLWTAKIGSAEKYFFTPAVVDNRFAYAAAADGTIEKIDVSSGSQVWRIKAGQNLSAGVGTDGQLIVVVGDKGDVLAFDAEGKQRWKSPIASEIVTPPAVGGGFVVVRSSDSHFYGLDAQTGARRWSFQRQPQALVLRAAPRMAIGNDLVYAGLPAGRLVALSLSNGSLRWDNAVATPKGATELERVTDIVGAPVLTKGNVCAIAYQGRVACFDAANGTNLWAHDLSSATGVDFDERFGFAADEKSVVNAIASSDGASVWKNDKLLHRGVSAPASVGRAVVTGDFEGILHWLSREDGSFIARTKTDGSPPSSQPVVFSSGSTPAVLVQTRDGNLYALGAE